jgi:hypothetical protein
VCAESAVITSYIHTRSYTYACTHTPLYTQAASRSSSNTNSKERRACRSWLQRALTRPEAGVLLTPPYGARALCVCVCVCVCVGERHRHTHPRGCNSVRAHNGRSNRERETVGVSAPLRAEMEMRVLGASLRGRGLGGEASRNGGDLCVCSFFFSSFSSPSRPLSLVPVLDTWVCVPLFRGADREVKKKELGMS